MNIEEIEQRIIETGATITPFPFADVKAVTIEQNGLHVGIRADLEERERKAVLAHELGHIKKGGLYQIGTPPLLRKKAECIANRYASEIVASPEEVKHAIKSGLHCSWELADYFGLPYEVMDRILQSYKARSVI